MRAAIVRTFLKYITDIIFLKMLASQSKEIFLISELYKISFHYVVYQIENCTNRNIKLPHVSLGPISDSIPLSRLEDIAIYPRGNNAKLRLLFVKAKRVKITIMRVEIGLKTLYLIKTLENLNSKCSNGQKTDFKHVFIKQ